MLTAHSLLWAITQTADAPTFMSEWGPLLGVMVGAILAGAAQVIAGNVQRRQEHDRETRDRKRAAYTDFLQTIDEYEIALVLLHSKLRDGGRSEPDEYTAALNGQIAAMHKFNSSIAALHLQGPPKIRAIADEIRDEITNGNVGERGSPAIGKIFDLEKGLITEMRKDLKIRDI